MSFRFLGIPVYIHPIFWVFLIFFTTAFQEPSLYSVVLGAVVLVSLLVHEYGHAATAQYFGAQPIIRLEAFGGSAHYNSQGMTLRQRFFITFNGPLFQSSLIALSYALLRWGHFQNHPYILYFLYATFRFNIFWCLLNLIPVMPLDGGHLVYYLLGGKFGEKGCKWALIFGLVATSIIAPYLIFKGLFLFGIMLLFFGYQNFQILRNVSFSTENNHARYMRGVEALKNDKLEEAKDLLKTLLKSKDTQIQRFSTESLAEAHYREKEADKAYDLLIKGDHEQMGEGKYLLCKLAFEKGNYALVCHYSRDIYKSHPSYDTAVLNSKSFAYLGDADLAGGWLETASLFGEKEQRSIPDLLLSQAYDSVRNEAPFKELVEKIVLKQV